MNIASLNVLRSKYSFHVFIGSTRVYHGSLYVHRSLISKLCRDLQMGIFLLSKCLVFLMASCILITFICSIICWKLVSCKPACIISYGYTRISKYLGLSGEKLACVLIELYYFRFLLAAADAWK